MFAERTHAPFHRHPTSHTHGCAHTCIPGSSPAQPQSSTVGPMGSSTKAIGGIKKFAQGHFYGISQRRVGHIHLPDPHFTWQSGNPNFEASHRRALVQTRALVFGSRSYWMSRRMVDSAFAANILPVHPSINQSALFQGGVT